MMMDIMVAGYDTLRLDVTELSNIPEKGAVIISGKQLVLPHKCAWEIAKAPYSDSNTDGGVFIVVVTLPGVAERAVIHGVLRVMCIPATKKVGFVLRKAPT